MNINLPPVAEVKAYLEGLGHAKVQELAKETGVPFTTLWKIRDGTTSNPGIETVRKFYPAVAKTNTEQAATESVAIAVAASPSSAYEVRSDYVKDLKAKLVTDDRVAKKDRRSAGRDHNRRAGDVKAV